ncbi:MAG: glycine oxidase ThiO [Chloroflexi bacterium]|nr:glycine oxidase ThiO [Chloroflexota bacterium]MCY3696721.1 glycine oxidase ThiO [Chloroflexota bacterium]
MSDVAIVGGGVIGLACAFELARRGSSVTVLEREEPGFGASTVAAGMLTPSFEVELTPQSLVELQLDSLRRYPQFVRDIEAAGGRSCGYRDEGSLWVSRHRDDELELDHILRIQQQRGLPARRLTGREVRALEPYVSPRAVGGLLVESDHQVDSRKLVPALRAACEAIGVDVRTGTGVATVERAAGAMELTCQHGGVTSPFHADQVLLAAGVWLEEGLVTPLPKIGMRPIKGQIVHLQGQSLVRHVIRNSDVYILPRDGGRLLIGATEEEQGFDMSPTAGGTLDLLRFGFEVLPGIYDLDIAEIDVGLRPTFHDHMPVLGATTTDGIYMASGHYRGGVLLAAATAHWMAEIMLTGQAPSEIEPFNFRRFVADQTQQEAAS